MNLAKVLVTGACGYLGSHLLRVFADRQGASPGLQVTALDNLAAGAPRALLDLPAGVGYRFVEADLLASGPLRSALQGVDAVVHLAALVRTPFAFDQPASLMQVNHWGTVRLLEQCREAGVRRFVFASSVSVYGPGEGFDEQSACRPIGPYSCSKREAEAAVLAANAPGFETTVLRMGTLYGGEMRLARFDAVPNRFVYLAGIGRSLPIFGAGQQRRPLVHVEDAARACRWALAQPGIGGEVFNLVEDSPSIEAMAQAIQGHRPEVRLHYTDQDYRDHLSLSVRADKIRAAGWSPSHALQEAFGPMLARFRGLASPRGGDL